MNIYFDKNTIKELCQTHGISYLGLFGSYARGEDKPASDIDLLVKFDKQVSLFDLARAQNSFSDYLHKDVDLVIEKNLKPKIRPYVEKDLQTIYEKR